MAVEESYLRKHENRVQLLYIQSWELDPDSSVIDNLSLSRSVRNDVFIKKTPKPWFIKKPPKSTSEKAQKSSSEMEILSQKALGKRKCLDLLPTTVFIFLTLWLLVI